ncbi:MAG: peptidyl-dipeptidase A, partial [Shewanella sp.]
MNLYPAKLSHLSLLITLALSATACQKVQSDESPSGNTQVTEAKQFIAQSEQTLSELSIEINRSEWIYSNFITQDTAALSASVGEKHTATSVKLATLAANYTDLALSEDNLRKLNILRSALVLPAPLDPSKNAELAAISSELNGLYGKGKYCFEDGRCLTQPELSAIMAESQDPAKLLEVWKGWREIAKPMRPLFEREVELANEGAQDLGYANLSELWRSQYDMKPDEFSTELDRLWDQVKPLYDSLHCYVRGELNEK